MLKAGHWMTSPPNFQPHYCMLNSVPWSLLSEGDPWHISSVPTVHLLIVKVLRVCFCPWKTQLHGTASADWCYNMTWDAACPMTSIASNLQLVAAHAIMISSILILIPISCRPTSSKYVSMCSSFGDRQASADWCYDMTQTAACPLGSKASQLHAITINSILILGPISSCPTSSKGLGFIES